jgi:hypothetical protein
MTAVPAYADFSPYAALNIGDEGCARARRRHGMAPRASDFARFASRIDA